MAQAAVHPDDGDKLIPPSLFETTSSASAVERLTALLPSLSLNKLPKAVSTNGQGNTGVHALTILARVLADPRFTPETLGLSAASEEVSLFARMNEVIAPAVIELTNEWIAGLESEGATADAISKKIEELAWMAALVYGVGGWAGRERAPTKKFNADFFT